MNGLNTSEVLEQRKLYGFNEIAPPRLESNLKQFLKILADPMGLMLLGLGILYWFLGNHNDAIILFISYIPVTAVDVLLELRAKNALKALSSKLKKTAKVIRNSTIIELPIKELVPEDLIIFEEGQGLPADGIIIECDQLQVNEAALTGESIPIRKKTNDPFLCGTNILTGRGIGQVTAIGLSTRYGKIAQMLEETTDESSPLEHKIKIIVKKILIVASVLAFILFIITFIKDHNWVFSLIQSLTFGMAAIPEEFPLVFTLYLSLGAYRLSKHGVLVKSLPSVETLGNVDVICTDKTGTLTEGKFQLETIEEIDSHSSPEELWQLALMACEEKPIDAMEMAIFEKADQYKMALLNFQLKWDYPFEPKGKHMSHVWEEKQTHTTIIAMKGSVEGVLEHCLVDHNKQNKIDERVKFWAGQGKRILALAGKKTPCTGNRSIDEQRLEFVGLCIFSDPIRNSAKLAILECQKAGIEIKMLTGDHPLTAHAIADELNMSHQHETMYTGDQLSKMNLVERKEAFLNGAIFSRVLPEQKFEMVETLKQNGKIVAMTGDGINDAPALKIADIGISMGENATDVAREEAQMILMKNDFSGIVHAIFEGRRVFTNLKRSFSYLISFHFPIIFFSLIPPLFNLGNILLPIHIVLLELVVHPVSAFSFENLPSSNNNQEKSLMSKKRFLESLLAGVLLSLGSFLLFLKFNHNNENMTHARSIVVTALLFGNIFFVFTETYPTRSMRFVYTVLGLLVFTLGILFIPFLAHTFYLQKITVNEIFFCLAIGFLASIPSFIIKNKFKL